MAEKKKVWLYQRVGKTAGADEKLARQKKDMLDIAAQQGWTTTGDVFDIGTGPSLTRPSITKLMQAAQEGKFDVLLIDKTPSICKDRPRALSVLAAIQERGVEIYCPEEGAIDAIREAQELRDQAGPISYFKTWQKCCEAVSNGAPSEGPELGMNMK